MSCQLVSLSTAHFCVPYQSDLPFGANLPKPEAPTPNSGPSTPLTPPDSPPSPAADSWFLNDPMPRVVVVTVGVGVGEPFSGELHKSSTSTPKTGGVEAGNKLSPRLGPASPDI